MTTLVTNPPRTASRTIQLGAAILVLGCVVLAFFDFFVTTSDGKFTYTADYWYTLDMYPFLIGFFLIISGLRVRQDGRGKVGAIIVTVGLAALAIDGVASMVSRNDQALGPLYPVAVLATIIGVITFTIASIRARTLPWWTTVALTVTWIVGGLVGDNGPLGFKGSALLLAAAGAAVATATSRTVTSA